MESGEQEVDIASADAGAVAGAYGNAALTYHLGETYTHMRVTILRKFTVKSAAAIDTGETPDACVTQASNRLHCMGIVVLKHERKFTHAITVADDATAAEHESLFNK